MNNSRLQEFIENIKNSKGQKAKSIVKKLRIVLKAFSQYSTTEDQLPPPTLIPVCLFVVPKLFRKLLNLEQQQDITEEPQNTGIKLCIQVYLRGLLKLLNQCQSDVKGIVVQSISQSMGLAMAFPSLLKKIFRAVVAIWSQSGQNLQIGLRCFVAIQKTLRTTQNQQIFMWGLRRVYMGYFQHCGQVNWRTLQHINFMGNCFCQLIKLNPDRAYYVLFGYLRANAQQLHNLNSLKGKHKIQLINKLYSQQNIQGLRLLGQAISRGGQDIVSLVYPFSELISVFQRVSHSNEYLPLKLHLVIIELKLMQSTGIYIPHVLQTINRVLSSNPITRKHSRKAGVQGSIELGYKLTIEDLKNTNIINDLFNKAIYCISWFSTLNFKSISGVELNRQLAKILFSLQFAYIGYKKGIKQIINIIKKDCDKIQARRSKKQFKLGDENIDKFQKLLSIGKIKINMQQKYKYLHQERQNILKAKLIAQQDQDKQSQQQQQGEQQYQQELESGWEEVSEGASQFEQPEQQKQQRQQVQDISYEGDPQDPDQAVKQWSEHEWSSQQQQIQA